MSPDDAPPTSDETPQLAHLQEVLEGSDRHKRLEAIRELGLIGPPAIPALPQLHASLKDSNPDIRAAAAVAVGFVGDPSSVKALLPLLEDEEQDVRFQTISALAFLCDPQVAQPLLERYEVETPLIRDQILRALGQLGDTCAYPLLERAIADTDPKI